MPAKPELRKIVRARLAQLQPDQIAEKSARICEAIARHPAWLEARVVCLFAAQATEPHVELLWKKIESRQICYPRVNGIDLDLIRVGDPASLQTSRWQLREPIHDEANILAPGQIDLLLVPGLAFSTDGERLGRGGGFYDRLISNPQLRAHKIGVCFDVQLSDDLPLETHDRKVDEVISETGRVAATPRR